MRMSEASIRAQWKKGQSGNPKGRPKKAKPLRDQGETLTSIARRMLDQPCQVWGSDALITRQTRFMRDTLERAEQGDAASRKLLFDLADRGDRRRLQALRAARRAMNAADAEFERKIARDVSPRMPGLRPDQLHLAAPAREVRPERLKPAPRERIEDYLPNGEVNPVALELSRRANLAKDARELDDMPFDDVLKKALARTETIRAEAERARAETAAKTGLGTGVGTGLITGLGDAQRPRQTIDGVAESRIHLDELKNSVALPAEWLDFVRTHMSQVNGAHVNGHNGEHR